MSAKSEIALQLTELAVELYETSDKTISESIEEIASAYKYFGFIVGAVEDGDIVCTCDECEEDFDEEEYCDGNCEGCPDYKDCVE